MTALTRHTKAQLIALVERLTADNTLLAEQLHKEALAHSVTANKLDDAAASRDALHIRYDKVVAGHDHNFRALAAQQESTQDQLALITRHCRA